MHVPTLFRRARAAVSIAAAWGLTWGAAASVLGGFATALFVRSEYLPISWAQLVGAFGLAGAISGGVSGLGFALIVATSGRRRTLGELSQVRLGLWSGVTALGSGLALFGMDPFFVAATAVFGFGAGVATVQMARRPDLPSLSSGEIDKLPSAT